jgi:hypothetical protein
MWLYWRLPYCLMADYVQLVVDHVQDWGNIGPFMKRFVGK